MSLADDSGDGEQRRQLEQLPIAFFNADRSSGVVWWQPGTTIGDRGRFPVSAGGFGCRPYEPAAWTAIDDAAPAPRRDARMRVKRLGSEGDLLGGRCLDGLEKHVIRQMTVSGCTGDIGVPQHLADGEKIDTTVDHERRR